MSEAGDRAIAEIVRLHEAIVSWITGRMPEDRFAVIVSGEDAGAAKPHRRFFDAMVERSGFRFDEMVSLGDREAVDLAPARALGMATRLVSTMPDVYALAPERENAP